MPTLATARSFLFVPGNDERRVRKAFETEADAVIVDLEDAVAAAEKLEARTVAGSLLGDIATRSLRLVRINGADTELFHGDLEAAVDAHVDGVVLPKAAPGAVEAMGELEVPVVAIVETARGLRDVSATAGDERVVALVLGAVDLGLELGLEPRADGQELLLARSTLVVESAAAGLRAPIDQVWTNVKDLEGLRSDCDLARSLGFRGKACVHPTHVDVINGAFSPSGAELERARRVVEAYEHAASDGRGAVALDGEMIDLPVVERARQLLNDAKGHIAHVD